MMPDAQDEPPIPPIPCSSFHPPWKAPIRRARPSPDRVPPPLCETPLPPVSGVSRAEILPVRLVPRRLSHPEAGRRRWELPPPLRLPVFHGLLAFFCLAFLPRHPLSIPTALGISCVIVFYIHVLANLLGFRLQSR